MNFKIFVKLFIVMVVFTSCGKIDNLPAFSKRKYLKNFLKQNEVKEKKAIEYNYIEEQEFYAGSELKPQAYLSFPVISSNKDPLKMDNTLNINEEHALYTLGIDTLSKCQQITESYLTFRHNNHIIANNFIENTKYQALNNEKKYEKIKTNSKKDLSFEYYFLIVLGVIAAILLVGFLLYLWIMWAADNT